jgi:seryl-tRNA synthetase
MYKRPVGRPKKVDSDKPLTKDEDKKEKQRKYMREYKARINKDIAELDKMERECQAELDDMRKQRKKLINELDKANKQAENILKEAVGKK